MSYFAFWPLVIQLGSLVFSFGFPTAHPSQGWGWSPSEETKLWAILSLALVSTGLLGFL